MAETKEYLIHQEDLGTIQISDEVISSIAMSAALEVEGVSGMMNTNVTEYMTAKNKKTLPRGVRVEKNEDGTATVTLFIMLKYSCNLGETAKKVQNVVYAALEGMTGFTIRAVNIHVGGISFD